MIVEYAKHRPGELIRQVALDPEAEPAHEIDGGGIALVDDVDDAWYPQGQKAVFDARRRGFCGIASAMEVPAKRIRKLHHNILRWTSSSVCI